jgi:hypothetical protein
MSAILMIAAIVLVGARARDELRLRQQALVLKKLPEADVVAYYEVLRRRVRNTRILRAIALISLLVLIRAWKHGLWRAVISTN